MPKFDTQDRCLQRIKAGVHANFLMEILRLHAVIAEPLQTSRMNI